MSQAHWRGKVGFPTSSYDWQCRFAEVLQGSWIDAVGNSILVRDQVPPTGSKGAQLTAVFSPPPINARRWTGRDGLKAAEERVLAIVWDLASSPGPAWRCGNAHLIDAQKDAWLTWSTPDLRISWWQRLDSHVDTFPWGLQAANSRLSYQHDVPSDVLDDGARVAALLDIRQMLGADNDVQEALTRILVDHDLQSDCEDFLIPCLTSPLWQRLHVGEAVLRDIRIRIEHARRKDVVHRISWGVPRSAGRSAHESYDIVVGRHCLQATARDVRTLERRWVGGEGDPRRALEIARLCALYSVFDNPLSDRRSGIHLALEPALRLKCDYELFASPLNAALPNGRFASRWPHLEWRFGSMGSYPAVMQRLPVDAVVCVNPPFTRAYLADVMERLPGMKSRFRLRVVMPIKDVDASWRKRLFDELPSAQLFHKYYDATAGRQKDIKHHTLLWEDPHCDLFIARHVAPPIEFCQQQKGEGELPPPRKYRYFPPLCEQCGTLPASSFSLKDKGDAVDVGTDLNGKGGEMGDLFKLV